MNLESYVLGWAPEDCAGSGKPELMEPNTGVAGEAPVACIPMIGVLAGLCPIAGLAYWQTPELLDVGRWTTGGSDEKCGSSRVSTTLTVMELDLFHPCFARSSRADCNSKSNSACLM